MVDSHDDDDDEFSDKSTSRSYGFHLLKADNDLFDDKSYVAHKFINVRHIGTDDNEEWEISENNQVFLSLKSNRFSNAEKKYLRSLEGMKFLMAEFKSGTRSMLKLKDKLKQIIKYD